MTRTWPVAGLLFGVLWVFVQGPPLAPAPLVGSLLIGLAVGFPTAFVFRRLYGETVDLPRSIRGVPYASLYALTFVREAIVASLDVTYRVLAPSVPIESEVILIPLRVRTDLGVTTIANSITMTPGSLTLNYDPEENALYVHVIDGSDPEDIVDPIRTWENYALVIFDEALSPSDPAPDFAVYPPDRTHPALKHAVPEAGDSQGDQPDDQPADPPDDQSADPPEDQPADSPGDQPADPPDDQPADQPADPPDDQPADQPADPPDDQPADPPEDQPVEEETGGDGDGR